MLLKKARKNYPKEKSGHFETNLKRPSINTELEINLKEVELISYLKSPVILPGRYILYLSNALTFGDMDGKLWFKLIKRFLINMLNLKWKIIDTYSDYIIDILTELVLDNKRIFDGSFIIAYAGFGRFFLSEHKILIFEKTNGKILHRFKS